ncbi:peptidoglycan editing factor PgeF [Desulfurobacterium thermolithotrophum]|uniref:peptidoglycan editing factor PgeF n=1 Tax=Desulfurobacterium thermolithotrophum TaxID=64160 RepID=UPI0013D82FE7|nr:peptidoglycan editing factor PgeF [Desulfurobacterium thermolithotrophum]
MKYEIFISEKPKDGREINEIKGIPVLKPIQVHGTNIIFVGRSVPFNLQADAIVTDSKNYWIGVLTADCLPVFLIGEGVVGVVHAGWRGTLKGIVFNTVKYISEFSAVKKAILGVSICSQCYEVGDDVYSLYPKEYSKCFKKLKNGKFLFDLKEANKIQLKAAGVHEIEDIKKCTVCNNDIFHSYRAEKTDKRILSAIRII